MLAREIAGLPGKSRIVQLDASRDSDTISVLFLATTTNREVFGRLRGVSPERFEHAKVDQLREALIGALSGDDD